MRQPTVSGPKSNKALESLPILCHSKRVEPQVALLKIRTQNQLKTSNHARLAKESGHQALNGVFRPDGTCLRKQRGSSGAASCCPACPRVWSTPRRTAG